MSQKRLGTSTLDELRDNVDKIRIIFKFLILSITISQEKTIKT
jgi:hypothetical protein